MKRVRALGALALAAFSVTTVSAQATGGLRIRVIDNSDKSAVIGATVTLASTNKLVATSTLVTDRKGIALFPVLRAGSGYVVTVSMDGYAGIRQELVVTNGQQKDVAIALAPEHVERVEIIESKSIVDLDNNQTSTSFSSEFIADLPVAGRFYQNVLALAPGVQDPDGDGNPNVNGARERDFKTQVGGISNVDPLTGTFLNLVTADSIEDLTVITAGAGAEFGRAQGGFAQIIQKQGSNDFEGVFGFIYASKLLDGTGSTNTPSELQPDFYNYQPSLQVSGPIVADKLWYRLSQEAILREDPLVLASGGATKTLGTRRYSTDNQITWQVSSRNKIAFNFRADPLTQTNVGISALTPVESTEKLESGGPTYTLAWTAPYSPSLLVDSTVAYQDTHLHLSPTKSGVKNSCFGAATYLEDAQCFDVQNGMVSGSSARIWKDARQRLTVKSDATFYKGRLGGAVHQFKFGLAIENERYFRALDQNAVFFSAPSSPRPGQRPGRSFAITASLDPHSEQRATATALGVYGEDVIRPVSNLSVTVGLRVEQENVSGPGFRPFDPQAESDAYVIAAAPLTIPQRATLRARSFIALEDRDGALAAINAQFPGITIAGGTFYNQMAGWNLYRQTDDINIQNTNVSPRLSVAWDPWNDGKTKFAVSAGRYYDKIFLGVLTQESQPVDATFTVPVASAATVAVDPTFSFTSVDRHLKTPYNDEFTISAQRTFLEENSISLTYVRRSFKHQLERHNINQVPGDFGRCAVPLTAGERALVNSNGTGRLLDPYSLTYYEDTDPGPGDGRLDDCTGIQIRQIDTGDTGEGGGTPPPPGGLVDRPDGVPDFYVLNPAWGDIRRLGNNNTAEYQGLTLEFVRRQYKNWQMEASYTLSEAIGDSEDFSLLLGNDRSTLEEERGYLSYDRTHSVKVNATCITPWGFRLGGAARWESGLPYSLVIRNASLSDALPTYNDFRPRFTSPRTTYPTHQRNDQRNRSAWNFDVNLVKELSLPKGMNLQLQAKVFNVLGEDTYVVYNTFTKLGEQVNGTDDATRRFGRQYEVGMRLAF